MMRASGFSSDMPSWVAMHQSKLISPPSAIYDEIIPNPNLLGNLIGAKDLDALGLGDLQSLCIGENRNAGRLLAVGMGQVEHAPKLFVPLRLV